MPPRYSRQTLEEMKRADLQKLCKEFGVKANLKTEDLIDLLLDSQTPAPPRATPTPRATPQPQPMRRSVSVRQPSRTESAKAGPSRVSSMIVHDLTEDEEEADAGEDTEVEVVAVDQPPSPPVVPPPRTRKAKETQTRLGKGKPAIAGGSGPRAVTTSAGSSKGKRAKSSKSMKPREPTIEEEPETLSATKAPSQEPTQGMDLPFEAQSSLRDPVIESSIPTMRPLADDSIRTLLDQIKSLRSELSQIASMKSEIANLRGQMTDVCKTQKEILTEFHNLRELPSLVTSMKEDIRSLKEGSQPSRPSTPKPKPGQRRPVPISALSMAGPSQSTQPNPTLPHPGIAPSMLGKRHRDSSSSVIDGVVEEAQQEEISDVDLAKTVIRPDKKRAKLQKDATSSAERAKIAGPSRLSPTLDEPEATTSNKASSGFSVYRGSESHDPPPPTNYLPEIFIADSPTDSTSNPQAARTASGVPTSTANASENQPFSFAFATMTSTPQDPMFMPSFPDPPQSPSPAGPGVPTFAGRRDAERTDIFKEFGLPSPVRSIRNYGALASEERAVNPAALQGTSGKRGVSSNEVAVGLGLTAHRTTSSSDPPSTEAPAARRTMYGTELEGDTRFGDFGVEGVASGFWLSK